MKKLNKDRILGIASILISLWIYYLTTTLPESQYQGDPGSAMFPLIGAVIMFLCGLAVLIKPGKDQKVFMTAKQWKAAGVIFGIYILCAVLFWLIGFMFTVPIILFLLTFLMSAQSRPDEPVKKRLIKSIIYAIIAGALVYVAYVIGLQAKLPNGILFK